MRITSLEEYGLRCALQLAKFKGKNRRAAAPEIAELEGLSVEYVSKIMHLFKKSGLVNATRGIQGGFLLEKDPSEISVQSVLDRLAGSGRPTNVAKDREIGNFCNSHSGIHSECRHRLKCSIQPVWSFIFDAFERVLTSITLADLLPGAPSLAAKLNLREQNEFI